MQTLCDILERVRRDDRPDLLHVRAPRQERFRAVAAREFLGDVERCASLLGSLGIGRGDRVGLVCENRPEWHVVDFGCYRVGAVPVPLFPTLTASEAAYCFADSGCRLVVVDSAEQLAKLAQAAERLAALESILVIDASPALPPAPPGVTVRAFRAALCECDERDDHPGPEGPDAMATMIYTSGTTGTPKGVVLTHANLLANVAGIAARNPARDGDIGLSVLPLCHAFERTVDYSYLAQGAAIAYSSPRAASADFPLIRPTIMTGVPRLYQKLQAAVQERIERSGAPVRWLYGAAVRCGERLARARQAGEKPRLPDRLLHPVLDRLVLRRVRAATGGRLRLLVSGGAALDPELNWWYAAVGWDLVQGYGLTESSPVISVNRPEDNRIGSVGRPLDNVQVRIDDDGEVLTRGPHVMKGYWDRADATAEALQDGWLRTGDVGRLADGYLYITDRKKAVLVTSTGKKVAPQPLENTLLRSPYIEQIMVVGEGRRFVAALIVPDLERLRRWARSQGLDGATGSLVDDPRVHELVQHELDRLQGHFAPYEQVRAFRLLERPFTVAGGQLTPTLKVVRRKVESDFADRIEEMYAG